MDLFSAFAFSAGMVALINPCGFALLPAYLGFFLGQDDEAPNRAIALSRAQGVGLALTLGMMVVFGFVGIVLGGLQSAAAEILPYFNIVFGIALIGLGIAMLRGFQLVLSLPKLNKGGQTSSFASMFLFGVSYAIASLTCTIAVFSAAVSVSATGGGFGERLGAYLSYGAGMGLLATVLVLLLALGKRELVGKFRSLLPKINIFSAILLLLVGPWMIGYGIWEIQIFGSGDVWGWLDAIMGRGLEFQGSLNSWFSQSQTVFGRSISRTALLGWPFLLINLFVAALGMTARLARKQRNQGGEPSGAAEPA